jgi:hypothetical protein
MTGGDEFGLAMGAELDGPAMARPFVIRAHNPMAFAIPAFFAIIDMNAGRALTRST